MTDKKHLIPIIRKVLPKMIAEDIVGVQPITGIAGSLFSMKTILTSGWSEWEKTFIWWPKRSIFGKLIFGLANKSERHIYDHEVVAERTKTELKYASNKELFVLRLKGYDDS